MKKTLTIIALAALMLFSAGNSHSNKTSSVIILQGQQTFARTTDGYGYTGIEVYCADGIDIPLPWYNDNGTRRPGQSLAKCVSDALKAGYRIHHIDGLNVWLVKD